MKPGANDDVPCGDDRNDDGPDIEELGNNRYVQLLADCHEAVLQRSGSGPAASLPVDTPDEVARLLRRQVYCLELLEQCRRDTSSAQLAAANLATPGLLASAEHETLVDDDVEDLPLQRLGRFKILRELGRGGHGIVFLAIDETLNRYVALKVPRPECLLSKQMRRRFLREAHAAARLAHPNLLAIYESGEEGPLCYLASAFCTGPTLAAWQQSQSTPVPERLAAEIVMALAEGVAYAHDRGVLHRDIKPGNVFLDASPAGFVAVVDDREARCVPKLGDFGLAQLLDDDSDGTRTGAVLGTPAYMAPEQARGQREQIGPATDVYGLGTILFELLTGRPPFQGRSDVDILRQVVTDDAPTLRATRRDLSRDLDAICAKCLEKQASRRYASAGELAADLRRYLTGEPILARQATTHERLLKWTRRHPTGAALWGVSSVAILVLILGTLLSNRWLRQQRDETAAALKQSQASEHQAQIHLYASDMKRAYESLLSFDIPLSLKLLTRHIPIQGESDLREFSWNYLWRTLHREQRRLPRHPGEVYAIALSPDGQRLATACRDGKTRLWDYATGRFEFELAGHSGEVCAVCFSHDGTRLVTGSDDGYAMIWNLDERRPIARFLHEGANEHPVTSVMLSPDGERLYTAAGINLVCWNVAAGERTKTFEFFNDHTIKSASLSPDGRYLAAAVVVLRVYRTDTWEQVFEGPGAKENGWSAVQFFADSDQFAASGSWRNVHIFDLNQDKPKFSRRLSSANYASAVPHSSKRQILAIGNRNNAVHIVSSDPAIEREAVFLGHTSRIWDVKFVNDGSSVVSAGADGEVIVWPAPIDAYWSQPSGILLPYENPKLKLRCLTYSPDGRRLVFGGDEPNLHVLDCLTGQIDELPNSGVASAVAFLPDGKGVVYGAQAGEHGLQLYDLESNRGKRLTELADDLTNVTVSPRGDLLAFACGNAAHVLTLPSGKLIRSMQTDKESITAIGFSASGERFAMLTGPELIIYDSATWQRTLNISAGEGQYLDIEFFPDGKRMVVAEGENGAAIRDATTGRLLSQHLGHPGLVDTVAVAPDGQHIASVCGNDMLQIWDVRSEQSLMHFENVHGSPRAMQFSPSGGELAIVQDRATSNLTILDARPIVVTEPLPPISESR